MARGIISRYRISPVIYMGLSIGSSVVNFLTLILLGRIYSIQDYAIVTTLQAFIANLGALITPLQIMICKLVTDDSDFDKLYNVFKLLRAVSLIELLAMIFLVRPLRMYLGTLELVEYVLFVIVVVINNYQLAIYGIAQGMQKFVALGFSSFLLFSIKMIASVGLGIIGIRPIGVVVAFGIADMFAIVYLYKKTKCLVDKLLVKNGKKIEMKSLKEYTWTLMLYLVISFYFNNGDILLGNLYNGKDQIGLYSVAVGLAKISNFLIATPVATILLPKVAAVKDDNIRKVKYLALAEFITIGITLVYDIAYYYFSDWIIVVMYGDKYVMSAEYVLPTIIYATAVGTYYIFYQYVLATDTMKFYTILSGIIMVIVIGVSMSLDANMKLLPILFAVALLMNIVIYCTYMFIKNFKRGIENQCT